MKYVSIRKAKGRKISVCMRLPDDSLGGINQRRMSFPETGYVIKGITPEDAYNWMMTHTSFGLPFGRLVQQLQDYNRQALTSTRPGSLPEYHTHYGVTA